MKVPGNTWIHCMFYFELGFDHCEVQNTLFLSAFGDLLIHSQPIVEELHR